MKLGLELARLTAGLDKLYRDVPQTLGPPVQVPVLDAGVEVAP